MFYAVLGIINLMAMNANIWAIAERDGGLFNYLTVSFNLGVAIWMFIEQAKA